VYESNGPDVKVRGTAQTIADKYLQLGRDAQSSGDIVMAESYFQYAEHYLRIVSAAQAFNQQNQQQYRRPDEEFDDEDLEDHPESATGQSGNEPEGLGDQPMIEAGPERAQQQQPNQGQRQQRDGRDSRDQNRDQNREQGGRDRFRPRWQDRRNDNQQGPGGEPRQNAPQPRMDEQPRAEPAPAPQPSPAADGDRWEAPSFLRRPAPTPAPAEPVAAEEAQASGTPAPKRKYERRPRKEVAAESPSSAADDVKAPAAD
jgi:hypothetical protein